MAAYQDRPEYRKVAEAHPAVLAERHARRGKANVKGDAVVWAEEAGFDGAEGLAEGLRRSAIHDAVKDRISRQLDALQKVFPTGPDGVGAGAGTERQ